MPLSKDFTLIGFFSISCTGVLTESYTTKNRKKEKHLSQEGLHETVGFEKAHFSFRKC